MSVAGPLEWTMFWVALAAMLAVDLLSTRGEKRAQSVRKGAAWSAAWT